MLGILGVFWHPTSTSRMPSFMSFPKPKHLLENSLLAFFFFTQHQEWLIVADAGMKQVGVGLAVKQEAPGPVCLAGPWAFPLPKGFQSSHVTSWLCLSWSQAVDNNAV